MHRLLLSIAFAVVAMVLTPGVAAAQGAQSGQAVAIFAGGCFWCTEADFDKVAGVISTTSGYIGGKSANPTYEQVSSGGSGHAEAVRIVYDPGKVSYEKLLTIYWRTVDPTVKSRQFCDTGDQYRTAIFVGNDAERKLAEASKQKAAAELKQPIHTQIAAAGPFYNAEAYHQDFYQKNPTKYKFYRWNCGRDQRLEQLWGKPKGEG